MYVTDGAATTPGRVVHRQMHITFPQWSPTDRRLSLWGTFMPSYRSLPTLLGSFAGFPLSVRPGDPAFVLDTQTGESHWLAIDAREKAQLGHFYMLQGDYEQAWKWYEQAAGERPAVGRDETPEAAWQRWSQQQDPTFFEYICLDKLGRDLEARERLALFRATVAKMASRAEFVATLLGGGDSATGPNEADRLFGENLPVVPFLTDLYIAEAFLSVDLADDGIVFLRQELDAATTDADRLAHATALSQLLLIAGKHEAYADLVTKTWVPVARRFKRAFPNDDSKPDLLVSAGGYVFLFAGAAVLMPLVMPEFVATLPDAQMEGLAAAWNLEREGARDNYERLALDLVLHTAAGRLNLPGEKEKCQQRLADNPLAKGLLDEKHVDEFTFALGEHLRKLTDFVQRLPQ